MSLPISILLLFEEVFFNSMSLDFVASDITKKIPICLFIGLDDSINSLSFFFPFFSIYLVVILKFILLHSLASSLGPLAKKAIYGCPPSLSSISSKGTHGGSAVSCSFILPSLMLQGFGTSR